jgi:hypothetical protein
VKNVIIALPWAVAVVILAIVMRANGANDGTVFSVVIGLSTAAIIAMRSKAKSEGNANE